MQLGDKSRATDLAEAVIKNLNKHCAVLQSARDELQIGVDKFED